MGFLGIKMQKASWIILVVFVILFYFDLYSTLQSGEYAAHLETNILFIILGKSWFVLILMNIFAVWIFLFTYSNKNTFSRYVICSAFTWLSLARILAIISNFKTAAVVNSGKVAIEAAKAYPASAKIMEYTLNISLVYIIPLIVTICIYFLFRLDNKVEARQ